MVNTRNIRGNFPWYFPNINIMKIPEPFPTWYFPDIFTWKIPVYQIQCIPGIFLVYTRKIRGNFPWYFPSINIMKIPELPNLVFSQIYLPGKYQCIKFNVSPEFSWCIPEKYREFFPDIILVVSTREIPGTTNLVFPWCVFQENTRITLPIFTWSFPGVNTRKSESLNAWLTVWQRYYTW